MDFLICRKEKNMSIYKARAARKEDVIAIMNLYKKVSQIVGGLARTESEITEAYVENFVSKAQKNGQQCVIEHPEKSDIIIAEIHSYSLEPKVFSHVLSELTIAVDPDFQGKGLGKIVFTNLLESVKSTRPEIMRVELIARESNVKAIQFYQSLGFKIEGRMEDRIRSANGQFEADIPMAWFNPNYK